ncbi:DUF4377 domain-containing protein [Polaribacter aquimarinus]|uniref:DUF4377 domain-containing protein n=1 Tax=Polaribacter aquimarinus TaxID=2100726 RepID=A0A2U2JD71_9FLAO|nr:DUF4377 domain-containing protein [Polaribacter aquimarinus]PWG06221.1 hypothetical protein DIS07_05010 [Polaribacter aquimarinus]
MKVIFIFFSIVFLTSCPNETGILEVEKTLIIASKKVECVGVSSQQCFLIKENEQQSWEYFYDSINDFNYEEGFEYVILVIEEEIENPPQDASSIKYSLVKVISKIKKTSENLPN